MHNNQTIEAQFNMHYEELNRLQRKLDRLNESILGEEPQTRAVGLMTKDALIKKMRQEQSICVQLAKQGTLVTS